MTRPPVSSSTTTTAGAASKRHRRRPSHPASTTDPFNAPDSDSTDYATGTPAGTSTTDLHPDAREINVDPACGGTEADLAAYSTRDLKSWLRARGRSMQGTKPQLVRRVWQLLNSDDSDYSSDADADDERGGGESDASGFWTDTSTTAPGVASAPAAVPRPPRNRRRAPSPATLEELIMTPIEQQPWVRGMSRRAERCEREREMDVQPISNEAMARLMRRIRDQHVPRGREPAGSAPLARDS